MTGSSDTSETDRELVDAVLARRDERAFLVLHRRYTPRLFALVARLLARGDEEAEDVVQETWIRAFQNMDRFEWKSSFATWLTGIGLNRVRNRIRSYGRSRETGVDVVPEIAVVPDHHESRIDLERLIGRLPDDQRLVFVLHDVEGMKHREIAEYLGIPEGTSKTQLSKARKWLCAMMPEEGAQA